MPVAFFSAVLAAVGRRGFAPVRFSGLAITYITLFSRHNSLALYVNIIVSSIVTGLIVFQGTSDKNEPILQEPGLMPGLRYMFAISQGPRFL